MWIAKPKLSRLAQDTIAALARDGIVCDPDEVLWINAVAEQATRKSRCDITAFLDLPVICGNAALYPLSIGAREWLRERYDWFAVDDGLFQLAEAYAMAHGRQPDKLPVTGRLKTTWTILRWARSLNVSTDELSRAMDACIGGDDMVDIPTPKEEREAKEGAVKKATADYGDIIATLAHFYPGHTLAYWLWEISEDEAASMLERTAQFLPPDQQVSADSARMQNAAVLRLVIKRIRENHASVKVGAGSDGVQCGKDMDEGAGPQVERTHVEPPDKKNNSRPDNSGANQKNKSVTNSAAQELTEAGNKQ